MYVDINIWKDLKYILINIYHVLKSFLIIAVIYFLLSFFFGFKWTFIWSPFLSTLRISIIHLKNSITRMTQIRLMDAPCPFYLFMTKPENDPSNFHLCHIITWTYYIHPSIWTKCFLTTIWLFFSTHQAPKLWSTVKLSQHTRHS